MSALDRRCVQPPVTLAPVRRGVGIGKGDRIGRGARGLPVLLLTATLAAAGACQPSPTGIQVDVDMSGGFKDSVKTLQITVDVSGGFKPIDPAMMTMNGVSFTTTATGQLVMVFSTERRPFTSDHLSFRLETGNQVDQTVSASAVGFDASNQKIASATASNASLPRGGEARIVLPLMPDVDGTNLGNTLLDLATARLDRTVTAPARPANPTTLAVCNLEGVDEGGDLVIGVPNADMSEANKGTGAVYVVPHATGNVDLAASNNGQEFHFYGVAGGDQLGASIACFDFDGDGADDLIVGAPGAYGAPLQEHAGRVYILQGRSMLRNRSVDLALHQADLEFVGGAASAALGQQVFAAALQGGDGEVLIAAPGEGSGIVHLVTIGRHFVSPPPLPKVLSGIAAGHITFSGIHPDAIAVGDLDGDGSAAGGSEIILGDAHANLPGSNGVGAVYVFRNVDPLAATAYTAATAGGATGTARVIQGTTTNQALGASLLVLNLTGHQGPDLIIGAPGDSDGRGAVRIYENQSTFFSAPDNPKWTFLGASASERFGTTLASGPAKLPAGSTPLQIGAPEAASGNKDSAGAVYTYARTSAGTMPAEVRPRLIGGAAKDRLGADIAAGPIGAADKISDLVMLAPGVDGSTSHPGVAYVRLAKPAQ